jgi:HEAT repeat protein
VPCPALHIARVLLAAAAIAAPEACAQLPKQDPAPPLEIPAQSEAARAQAGQSDDVLGLLDRDAPATEWRALGDAAVPALERVANSTAMRTERRLRAIAALGAMGTPAAIEKLRALALGAKAQPACRAQAVKALAKAQGMAAVVDLAPLLAEAKGELCTAVAQALASLGGPDAKEALEQRLAREGQPEVRELLQKSLSRLQP